MKNFLLMILLLCFNQANSQTPDWVWCEISSSAAGGVGEGISVATDNADNVYISGWYTGSITFGSTVLTNYEGAYIAKYDSNGNLKWADGNLGSHAAGSGVCTDKNGNVYTLGGFEGSVMFGSQILSSVGNWDVFLIKYDSLGNVIWARSAGGTNQENARSIAIDSASNVYILGDYSSSVFNIGSYTLINPSGLKIFLAKYDSSGNVLWARSSTDGGGYAYSAATDALGNIFIAGDFYTDSVSFGSYTLHEAGNGDIFIAKYDSSGNALWAKRAGGTADEDAFCITTDAFNNAYLAGRYKSSSITFGSYTLTNAGDYDAYLVKYNSSGNVLWAKTIGDSLYEAAWGLKSDGYNKVYFTGGFTSPINFDTISVGLPLGSLDPMFIVGYDLSGNALFAKGVASGGDDFSSIAVATSSSCIYIGGDFEATILILGNDTLISSGGNENVFVGKLCYPIGVSIPEISKDKEFILYPNPFQNNLNIFAKENEQTEIILYDILSRKLLQRNFTNTTTINTEQLTSGLYIYEVRNKNGILATGKVVKQ